MTDRGQVDLISLRVNLFLSRILVNSLLYSLTFLALRPPLHL